MQADELNRLTAEAFRRDPEDCFEPIFPVLELLSPGCFLVTLDDYYPTDGEGNFFWTAFPWLRSCDALSRCVDVSLRPVFLAPTQPPACFRAASLEQAGRDFRHKPVLALYLSGKISALLDGHHRALCAALKHETLPCITIASLDCPDGQLGDAWTWMPRRLEKRIEKLMRRGASMTMDADEAQVEEYIRQVRTVNSVELPAEYEPADVRRSYPDVDAVAGLEIIGRGATELSDETIDAALHGFGPDLSYYGDLVPMLLKTLFGFRDCRARDIGLKVAGDFRYREYWQTAFELLATDPCAEVDQFFLEFLIHDDGVERAELEAIACEYFRRSKRQSLVARPTND